MRHSTPIFRSAQRARLLLTLAAVALGLVVPASAAAVEPVEPVLGAPGLFPYGSGWGTARPAAIYNGGVPSGHGQNITWRNWGAKTARGFGRIPAYRPGGGYYSRLVWMQLRATRLGSCPADPATPAYTRLIVRIQKRPRGRYGDWYPWTLSLCSLDVEPRKCGKVAFRRNTDHGAAGITAWDVRCRTARRVARASRRVRVRRRDASYRFRAHGFVCNGYSFAEDRLPTIYFTCSRGSAVVDFTRS